MTLPLIAPALLASALAFEPGTRPPCHTAMLRETGFRMGVVGEAMRPDAAGYVDSELYPIRVHYRDEDDADRAADLVLPAAELAWQVQVEEMGWPAPPSDAGVGGSDALDFYLTNEDTYGGAWTWGPRADVVEDDGYYSIASFVALDDNARDLSDDIMPTFVVHEFNHVLQYGIDGVEATLFPWESTAEAMEELVLPDSNLYWNDVPSFQLLPFASLLFDGYSREIVEYDSYSYYEYGGAIAGLYLEQVYGGYDGTTLLQLWLDLAQGENAAEPDFVDALGMIGGEAAPTAGDVYLGLAEWRMFGGGDDDGAHFAEGASWGPRGKVATEGELSLATLVGSSVSPVDAPYDLGTSYWEIAVDGDTSAPLRLSVVGEGEVAWGIVAAVWLDGAPARVLRARGEDGAPVEAELDLRGATKIMVGVANLGVADLNAEGAHERLSFTLSFAAGEAAPDSGDTGGDTGGDETGGEVAGGDETGGQDTDVADPDGETVTKGGCACSAAPTASAWLGLGALALALGRRRPPARG